MSELGYHFNRLFAASGGLPGNKQNPADAGLHASENSQ